MLSLSAEISQQEIDLQVINGSGDGGVPFGYELGEFSEALVSRDEGRLAATRQALLDAAGSEVLVDAAAVAGNFQRMVRIADSTGIPVDDAMDALGKPVQEALNLRRFESARNTPEAGLAKKLAGIPLRFMAKRMLKRMS